MATSHFADVTCVLDASHTAPHKSNLFNLLKTAVTQKKQTPYRYILGFGYNRFGQLGSGNTKTWYSPKLVEDLRDMAVVDIQGGWHRSLVLTANGKVICSGSNDIGDVGVDSTDPVITTFQQVAFRVHIIKISASRCCHSLALSEDSDVYAWGSNKYFQLGVDNISSSAAPVLIKHLRGETISDIFAGGDAKRGFSFVLTDTGECYGWGINTNAQLGLGHSNECVSSPCLLSSLPPLKTMALGNSHVIAVTRDDRCLAWGNNLHGQLGLNEIGSYEEPPREIKTLRGFGVSTVACSDNFSVALTRDGRVFSWGIGGPLGHGNFEYRTCPQQIMALADRRIIKLSVGYFRGMALTDDHKVYSWGSNKYGMSGFDVEEAYLDSPQEAVALSGKKIENLCCGGQHTFVLTNEECL